MMTRRSKFLVAGAGVLAFAVVAFVAASAAVYYLASIPAGNPKELVGEWRTDRPGGGTVKIALRLDGSYTEYLIGTGLPDKVISGKWAVVGARLRLEPYVATASRPAGNSQTAEAAAHQEKFYWNYDKVENPNSQDSSGADKHRRRQRRPRFSTSDTLARAASEM